MSRGSEIIGRLDLPYIVKIRLGTDAAADLGDWIARHPREVVDAMSEVGVLNVDPLGRTYSVAPPPHKHAWRVVWYTAGQYPPPGWPDAVPITCSCGVTRVVPNRLPIEDPE